MLPYDPDHSGTGHDLADQPPQGVTYKWALGMALPACLILYGIHIILKRQAEFGGDISMTLHGWNATVYGIMWVCAGLFAHFHYFWGNVYNQAAFAVLGKIMTLICIVSGLIFLIIRIGVLGRE